jgi:hypothetical protein
MNEEYLKKQAQYEADMLARGGMASQGTVGLCNDEPCRTPLRERVERQQWDAVSASRRAEQLKELANLLDRNPEVCRILDLIELVRG